jgi:hypothetical protein
MIRHRQDNHFLLFTQNDHAQLSARLAQSLKARPSPNVIDGIALHDSGWPTHDDLPTINAEGFPRHVFEMPVEIATKVWSASARIAAEAHPYSGLLVSLHGLHLSLRPHASSPSAADVFELNKFQHAQIELQEKLRPKLELRIDRPLTAGLAKPGTSPPEDQLLSDLRLLQAMDVLSLALLCSDELAECQPRLFASAGGNEIELHIRRIMPMVAKVDPWLFETDTIELPINCRVVPNTSFADDAEFRKAYGGASVDTRTVRLHCRS